MQEALTGLAYLGAALGMGIGAIGAAVNMGETAHETCAGMERQPKASGDLMKTMLIGQAAAGSAPTFALLIALLLIFTTGKNLSLASGLAMLGSGLAIGIGATGGGIGIGLVSSKAVRAVARQPRASRTILVSMLVAQAVASTPVVFSLVISILLLVLDFSAAGTVTAWALLASGLCIGLGGFGPSIGAGMVGADACSGIGKRTEISSNIVRTMLLGQTVAQSSAIFALLVSLVLIVMKFSGGLLTACSLMSAGLCMGFGAIGPGIGSGMSGADACRSMGQYGETSGAIARTMLLGQTVSQSTGIYALVVALLLIFYAS